MIIKPKYNVGQRIYWINQDLKIVEDVITSVNTEILYHDDQKTYDVKVNYKTNKDVINIHQRFRTFYMTNEQAVNASKNVYKLDCIFKLQLPPFASATLIPNFNKRT